MIKQIKTSLNESSDLIKECSRISKEIDQSIKIIIKCLKKGNKIILFGNGGSAADSQHIAAELIGRFQHERDSIPALSLTTDTSILTSLSNDYSFEFVFSRQCESIVKKGDVVIGISTSGNSINIINGLKTAKKKNAVTIALLGNGGGKIKKISDVSIIVPSKNTALIQEAHRVIYHIICKEVEVNLLPNK